VCWEQRPDARERYLRGQRIELTALAAEHGVSRATAYRWFGDNDRLLAEAVEGCRAAPTDRTGARDQPASRTTRTPIPG
jgi:hypothetical protein